MIIKTKQCPAGLRATRPEFKINLIHLLEQTLESGIFAAPERIVLRNADLGEAIDELIDGHFA